ncbi:hypothetical protein niasHT_038879 [Heterodera trifolii]|uniref:Gustatory receptor n=1 Tax=Heterodera trifolii TaxID=157864 RepID=A0ABD2IMS6_9BILA
MPQYSVADLCNETATIILDSWGNIFRCVHCVLGIAILIIVAALVRQWHRSRFIFHGNLILLIASGLCLYILYTLALIGMAGRTLALYLFWPIAQFVQQPINSSSCGNCSNNINVAMEKAADKNSLVGCEALFVPLWLSMLLRLPTYQHVLIYPLLHFAIMTERARATLRARTYETEGKHFGVTACAIIWSLCALFSVWMILSTLADVKKFDQPQVYYSMISRYNNDIVITMNYVLLALVVLTAMADIAIIMQNRKMHVRSRKRFANASVSPSSSHGAKMAFGINRGSTAIRVDQNLYSLSRAYQLNENIVALQLFLPLDLAFALAFSLYLFFSAFLRSLYSEQLISGVVFIRLYELNTCFLPLHILVTVLVYLRFIWWQSSARRAFRAISPLSVEEQQRIYMQQLRKQWAAK